MICLCEQQPFNHLVYLNYACFFRCQVPFFRLVSLFCCCSVRPCPNETTVKSNEQWPKPVFICGIQGLCITLSFTDYQKPIVRILMNQSGFHDSCQVFVALALQWAFCHHPFSIFLLGTVLSHPQMSNRWPCFPAWWWANEQGGGFCIQPVVFILCFRLVFRSGFTLVTSLDLTPDQY